MGTRGGLLRPRKFEQSSGQVTLNRIVQAEGNPPHRVFTKVHSKTPGSMWKCYASVRI